MNRREFLKATAVLTALGTVERLTGKLQGAEPAPAAESAKTGVPDIVALRGGTPAEMFDRGIRELGGMGKFVKKGQVVTIKPNIAWDKTPELAANTNPDLVAHVVRECYKAGASKVYIFDTTCNFWEDTYRSSGIAEAAKKAGGIVVGGETSNEKSAYVQKNYSETPVPKGTFLKKIMMHNLVRDCDVFINMPVLKVHSGAKMTCCMKNLMGIVTKKYHRIFHQNLEQCIAENCTVRPPDLNIVDAYRVMITRGPRGVDASDVKMLGYQLIGKDMVALDTASAKMLNVPLRIIKYLPIGERLGLGTRNLKKLNIKRINCKA